MVERRQCQNPDCGKIHRCLPPQVTRFKHFLTEIIEDTVDDVVKPEDPDDPGGRFIESPAPRTVSGWKGWISHNTPYIDGYLRATGYNILEHNAQLLKSGIPLLETLRKDGGGWLAAVQTIIYNAGGALEPWYRPGCQHRCTGRGPVPDDGIIAPT